MRSRVATVTVSTALVFWACLVDRPRASAATKAQRNRAATEMVRTALRLEIEGKNSERRQALQSALEQVPDYAPAMWHRGYVRHQNQWLKFDQVPNSLEDDRRLTAYRRLREKSPETAKGQLELAGWCAKNKLADRARAHLTRVLELDPDHAEARRLLGYRSVDGVWLSQQEVREAAVRAAEVAAALKEWKPKVQTILEGLTHQSQRRRELARRRLVAIDDPAAIPALELVLSTRSEEIALWVTEVLDKIDAPEAATALARQAVFSRWERVREAAAEKLKSRDPVSYVPMLLSALQTPVQSRAELYRAPNGRLTYGHMLYREGQEQGELAVFETEYRRTLLSADGPASWGARRLQLELARLQDAAMKAEAIETAVARQNTMIQRLNERICRVLSKATGQDLPAAEAWWKWWNDYNEVYVSGDKPIQVARQRQTVAFQDPYGGVTQGSSSGGGTVDGSTQAVGTAVQLPTLSSCLLAGTLVWSDSGPVPIEQIRVGDLVLSQNPETGELAYKPVLKTTVRPPVRMLKIVFGGKALQSSGGHPFWIAGKGWVFARDLEEGTHLHTVEGTIEVRSVHPTGVEQLHNLVVADFHTYFVSEAKILTHDNTIRRPTNVVVPGLARRPTSCIIQGL